MRLKFKQKKIAVELAVDAYYAGGKAKVVGVCLKTLATKSRSKSSQK